MFLFIMRYEECIPLTGIKRAGDAFLIGGGGGNPLFGFQNKLVLLDRNLNTISEEITEELVVSIRVFGNIAVVEHIKEYSLYKIDQTIKKIRNLPAGIKSPVIIEGEILYIKEGRIERGEKINSQEIKSIPRQSTPSTVCTGTSQMSDQSLSGGEMGDRQSTHPSNSNNSSSGGEMGDRQVTHSSSDRRVSPSAIDSTEGVDEVLSMEVRQEGGRSRIRTELMSIRNRGEMGRRRVNNLLCVVDGNERTLLDGRISEWGTGPESSYIVQRGDSSVIRMEGSGKWTVLEERCVTIHSTGKDEFYVGTGDGEVISYRRGVERWRKKVFTSPVSGISSDGFGFLVCTCINGRVGKVSREGGGRGVVKTGILVVGVAACVGAVKYWAGESIRSMLGW